MSWGNRAENNGLKGREGRSTISEKHNLMSNGE